MKFVFAIVAGIMWLLVINGLTGFTLIAVVASFAALDSIINPED